MNYRLIIFTLILLIFNCQKDKKAIFIPKNYLQEFQTEKIQFFDLDTLASNEIIGKNGTKIYFNRSDFEVSSGEKITLELIELYDFNEILYRNLSTVTTDNEVLETNGVLYISFKSNNMELNLKKNKKLLVYPPEGKLQTYNIYNSVKDSLENLKWEISKQDYITIIENKGTLYSPIILEHLIHRDSFQIYKRREKENRILINKIKKSFVIENENFGWINIDKVANIDYKINFTLLHKENSFHGFITYLTYDNSNSFIYNLRLEDDLKFEEIPITIIGEENNILYYDKIELKKKLNNSEIILQMKKTTNKDLQKFLIK